MGPQGLLRIHRSICMWDFMNILYIVYWIMCGMCQSIAPEAISLFSHLGTWCVLHSSTSVHIHCSLSIVPFFIVFCLVVSSACVCVCLESPYCPCSVYNLQVGRTNTLVSFPHLQSPWCSVTQGPFQMCLSTSATQNTPVVWCESLLFSRSHAKSDTNNSVSNESLWVMHEHKSLRVIPNAKMSIHIAESPHTELTINMAQPCASG